MKKFVLALVVGVLLTVGANVASNNYAGEAEHPDPTSYTIYKM